MQLTLNPLKLQGFISDKIFMGMLDRYRKPGGFAQLLNLLETSPGAKQEKFLALIFEESPAWAEEVKKRMLSFENILTWSTQDLMEFIPRMPDKIVCAAIWGLPDDQIANLMKSVSPQQRRYIQDTKANNAAPTSAEIATCKNKFVIEARTAGSNGALKFEKINPDLVIPEGIEAKLRDKFDPHKLAEANAPSSSGSGSSSAASPSSSAKSVNTSSAPATTASITQSEELFNLRRQVLQMERDLKAVRHENEIMKSKLDQIKKIA